MDWFVHPLGAAFVLASLGSPWAPWPKSAPIELPAGRTSAYVILSLEPAFDPTPDLRIVDQNGAEVPYVTDPEAHRPGQGVQREIPLPDSEFIAGAYTQAVIDFGADKARHEAVTLSGGTESFFDRVRIESSDDRTTWTLVRKDAYIYRAAADKSGNLTVTFPPSRSRYVRLQILDSRAKFPLTGWSLSASPPEQADSLIVRAQAFVAGPASAQAARQTWSADFGRPVSAMAVQFDGAPASFTRTVSVEAGPNGSDWHVVGSGTIATFAKGAPQTAFAFPEERARFWRVAIDNGASEKAADLMPRLLARAHTLLFEPAPGRTYVLLAGNDLAAPPAYPLAAAIEREDWSAQPATLGSVQTNAAFEDARPIFERYPLLMSAGFALGALGLVILALRTLRPRPRRDPRDPPPAA